MAVDGKKGIFSPYFQLLHRVPLFVHFSICLWQHSLFPSCLPMPLLLAATHLPEEFTMKICYLNTMGLYSANWNFPSWRLPSPDVTWIMPSEILRSKFSFRYVWFRKLKLKGRMSWRGGSDMGARLLCAWSISQNLALPDGQGRLRRLENLTTSSIPSDASWVLGTLTLALHLLTRLCLEALTSPWPQWCPCLLSEFVGEEAFTYTQNQGGRLSF